MTVDQWRKQFPAITEEDRIPFNGNAGSPLHRREIEARKEFERVWIEAGNPWEAWVSATNEAKERFADLINADPDEIAVLTTLTQALAQVASAFDYNDSNEVVVSDLDFPTVPQFWHGQRKRGAEVQFAESPDGIHVPNAEYESAMTDDTLMVCTAHAYPFTGGLVDLRALADAVHERDGWLFVDAYQSAGIVPIDVKKLGIDFLATGTYKFLLGGPGIAFLYVDEQLTDQLVPANMGWFSVDDIFDFEISEPQFANTARRFEAGSPPVPSAYRARAGIELITEVGVENIRRINIDLSEQIIDGVESNGFDIRSPHAAERRGGLVNVQVKQPKQAAKKLMDAGFNLSYRAGGLRLAPHLYNTPEDVDKCVNAIAEMAYPR